MAFEDHSAVGSQAAVARNSPPIHQASIALQCLLVPAHNQIATPLASTSEFSSRNGTTEPAPNASVPTAQKTLMTYLPVLM